ncbi:hypothetical protein ACFW1A_40070 [Kitasatospora sp. NPDC058965]|uniref:hypothetical protein n=1 Tax=Kitasatospora sp. NPDC058965 TaxID=3346682 RepID=UPI0036AAE8AB
MLDQALLALATAGGTAVVKAAGTDAWSGLRLALAHWFGRADGEQVTAELERLDQSATALAEGDGAGAEQARIRHETVWQTRIEARLEALADAERAQAATALRALLEEHGAKAGATVTAGQLAVGGNLTITAGEGSVAAGVIHGGVGIGIPSRPAPPQG